MKNHLISMKVKKIQVIYLKNFFQKIRFLSLNILDKDDMIILKNDQRTPEQLNKEIEKCDGHLKESNQDENISEV